MNIKATSKNFVKLGQDYGFKMVEEEHKTVLQAKNIYGRYWDWIVYDHDADTVLFLGNSFYLNLHLAETRKDLTVDKLIEFNNKLNEIFNFGTKRVQLAKYIGEDDFRKIAHVEHPWSDDRFWNS